MRVCVSASEILAVSRTYTSFINKLFNSGHTEMLFPDISRTYGILTISCLLVGMRNAVHSLKGGGICMLGELSGTDLTGPPPLLSASLLPPLLAYL